MASFRRWLTYRRHLTALIDAHLAAGYQVTPTAYTRMQASARAAAGITTRQPRP
jgi:hypothetical protein